MIDFIYLISHISWLIVSCALSHNNKLDLSLVWLKEGTAKTLLVFYEA